MSDHRDDLTAGGRPRSWRIPLGILAILAVVVAVAGLLSSRADAPTAAAAPAAGRVLVTDGGYECQGIQSFDLAAGRSQRPFTCLDRLLLAPDGLRAAARGPGGLRLIDLRTGATIPIMGTDGFATPIAWSPDGHSLQWITCTGDGQGTCHEFVGPLDDLRRSALPVPDGGGYWGPSGWSADSSRFIAPTGDGPFLIGAGDGSNLAAVTATTEFPILAPDGSRFAFTEDRAVNGNSVASDLVIAPTGGGGAPRRVTSFPDGTSVSTAAWAPDGRTMAVVSRTRPAPWIRPAVAPALDLWLSRENGETSRIRLPEDVGASAPRDNEYQVVWSPDSARLVILTSVLQAEGAAPRIVDPWLIDPTTGSISSISGARYPTWSPDGRSIAVVGADATGALTVDVMDRDGSGRRSLGRVSLGDWTQVLWAP